MQQAGSRKASTKNSRERLMSKTETLAELLVIIEQQQELIRKLAERNAELENLLKFATELEYYTI